MRLLHTKTGHFCDFDDPRKVRYAILSHVWAKGPGPHIPELTYQDALELQKQHPGDLNQNSVLSRFPQKIQSFCKIAAEHGYDYAWNDACCINKTSSSELSEAINSMYDWYRYAGVCYVYLHDVPTPTDQFGALARPRSPFRESEWHQRGWTLQELLAPSVVLFLSDKWEVIGTKHTLAALLEDITTVDRDVLTGWRPLEEISVARRMSWASSRKTTREEDEAYSLLGIFGVNLRTNYGEGRYAFIRLQQEILKQVPDQTIFAWGSVLSREKFSFNYDAPTDRIEPDPRAALKETASLDQYLLASTPAAFKGSANFVHVSWDEFLQPFGVPASHRPTYTTTSYGVRTHLPLLSVLIDNAQTKVPTCVALLACMDTRYNELTVLLLRSQSRQRSDYFMGALVGELHELMGGSDNINPFPTTSTFSNHYYRMARMSLKHVRRFREQFNWEDIYIPHWPSRVSYNLHRDVSFHTALRSTPSSHLELRISPWCRDVLRANGYCISQDRKGSTIDISRMAARAETIKIDLRHCDCMFGREKNFLSADVILDPPGWSIVADYRVDHEKHHPTHIQSWTFQNGAASKEYDLQMYGKAITMRLSFAQAGDSSSLYTLGVEIWDSAVCEDSDSEIEFVPRGRPPGPRQIPIGKAKPTRPTVGRPRPSSSHTPPPPPRRQSLQTRHRSLVPGPPDPDVPLHTGQSNGAHLSPDEEQISPLLRNLITSVADLTHTFLRGDLAMDADPLMMRSWSQQTHGWEDSPRSGSLPSTSLTTPDRSRTFAASDTPPGSLPDDDVPVVRSKPWRPDGASRLDSPHRGKARMRSASPMFTLEEYDSDDDAAWEERPLTGWRRTTSSPDAPGHFRMQRWRHPTADEDKPRAMPARRHGSLPADARHSLPSTSQSAAVVDPVGRTTATLGATAALTSTFPVHDEPGAEAESCTSVSVVEGALQPTVEESSMEPTVTQADTSNPQTRRASRLRLGGFIRSLSMGRSTSK